MNDQPQSSNDGPLHHRVRRERRIFTDRAYELTSVDLELPDGSLRERGVVRHRGAVVILPLLDDGRVVLIRNQRWVPGTTLIELPAGGIEPGERPEAAAVRECAEETGLRPGTVQSLAKFYAAPGYSDELLHGMLARDLQPVGQALEADESLEVYALAGAEAMRLVDRGEIMDAKTLALLAIASRRGLV